MNCSNRNQQHCSNFASVLWLFVVGSAGGVVVVVDGVAVVVVVVDGVAVVVGVVVVVTPPEVDGL